MMDRRRFVAALGTSAFLPTVVGANDLLLAAAAKCSRVAAPTSPAGQSAGISVEAETAPAMPIIIPVPVKVGGVSSSVVDLAGVWKFSMSPPDRFWSDAVDTSSWSEITVPGECRSQGFKISRDVEYAYRTSVRIPADSAGHRVYIRFDGVYSFARVWVNGKFIRQHRGGFTSWNCEITDYVTPGQLANLTVGVTDRSDDISDASNYAKHYIGGILRSVRLVILPANHVSRLHVETDFDAAFRDARLKVMARVDSHGAHGVVLRLSLHDPSGKEVRLNPDTLALLSDRSEAVVEIPITSPAKWDSEHPNLYTLRGTLMAGGSELEVVERRIGFRKIQWRGNKVYINGQPIKLRGVCRHDVHPLRGRCTSPEIDERDAALLRDANVNFVRTSHYPPTESFLAACDRYGIYVEEESAVCFVSVDWSVAEKGRESDPDFTSAFLGQFAEMIERDRSHPCVVIWSLGNESRWGSNFAKERVYAQSEDPSRPAIFSFPDSVPKGLNAYDIYSHHYPTYNDDLKSATSPRLNDEYAHISCYNTETLKRDPGVRNFWGRSLKAFWENCFRSDGCLGGAIWAGWDEVFLMPEGPVGYGEWGILDGWRRPKPEYWLTKKAYSPIRIAGRAIANPGAGKNLALQIGNWFDHTNLNEITIVWSVGRDQGAIAASDVMPHSSGMISIPARAWRNGEVLNLKFYRADRPLVDEFNLTLGRAVITFPEAQGPAPKVVEGPGKLTVSGSNFTIAFDKESGLLTEGVYRGERILAGGPFLNLGAVSLAPWWLTNVECNTTQSEAVIRTRGAYVAQRGETERVRAEFEVRIDGQGLLTTTYTILSAVKGTTEVGVGYLLSEAVDRLSWRADSLWSAYPRDHIGRPEGEARRAINGPAETYRVEPKHPWSQDMHDPFLYGIADEAKHATNDFRSLKENIYYASCILAGSELRVRAESDGTAAIRAEVRADGRVLFNVNNLWGYPDLAWGNYSQPVTVSPGYTNRVRMRLADNDRGEVAYQDPD